MEFLVHLFTFLPQQRLYYNKKCGNALICSLETEVLHIYQSWEVIDFYIGWVGKLILWITKYPAHIKLHIL
jgi:hypothetical protein